MAKFKPMNPAVSKGLVHEVTPQRRLEDLIFSNEVEKICREFIEEQHKADLLRSYNLEPRNRVLLIGPPGNGKTSLAEAIAEALTVPMHVVHYDSVVDSLLGETAARLQKLFESVRSSRCVLFFDEFETLGKERGDVHETGEIKRVVSSLLLQIDRLPSHVVVIGATNHPEMLDRAVWRRFQVRMSLEEPTFFRRRVWFERFQDRIGIDLGHTPTTLAKKLRRYNFADIEEFGMTVHRQYVLALPGANMGSIISHTLKHWAECSVNTADGVLYDDWNEVPKWRT